MYELTKEIQQSLSETDPERYGQQFSELVQVLQVAGAKLGLCTIFIGENACKGYRGGLGIGEGSLQM